MKTLADVTIDRFRMYNGIMRGQRIPVPDTLCHDLKSGMNIDILQLSISMFLIWLASALYSTVGYKRRSKGGWSIQLVQTYTGNAPLLLPLFTC